MNSHAALNRFYRLVWSDRLAAYVVAAENVRGRGQRAVRAGTVIAALLSALTAVSPAPSLAAPPLPPPPAANQLPTGGQVAAGAAVITEAGARMDVTHIQSRRHQLEHV